METKRKERGKYGRGEDSGKGRRGEGKVGDWLEGDESRRRRKRRWWRTK